MVERRSELKRRQARKKKMFKLKARLRKAKDGREKDQILQKIHVLSPWWKEAGQAQTPQPAKAPAATKGAKPAGGAR
jgi:hypothetical protein